MFDPGNYTPHYVENLRNALAGMELDVAVITSPPLFEPHARMDSAGVENYFFRSINGHRSSFYRRHPTLRRVLKALTYPAGLWRTWRALKKQSPGIFHVQWALLPVLDTVLIRKLRSKGWRIVYTAHDLAYELSGPLRRRLYRRIYLGVDAVIVHSDGMEQKLRNAGERLRQVRVIPEGISSLPLSAGLDQSGARRILQLDSTGPVLLFFGFIKPYKGLEYLLRAWARVHEQYPTARLLVAGEAMSPTRPFLRLIDSLRIQESVTLRLGYVPRSEVQYFFCAADAVVLPYTQTSSSGVVPLAYRYARPVIATCAGGVPEIVKDGETGFLVPPREEQALAGTICLAFRDRDRLALMGARGREWFESERRWDQVARQTVELYSSLV
jgi:glycosyltransferase involved in cell wall biosynthesis